MCVCSFFNLLICKALWITSVYELCCINKSALPRLSAVPVSHMKPIEPNYLCSISLTGEVWSKYWLSGNMNRDTRGNSVTYIRPIGWCGAECRLPVRHLGSEAGDFRLKTHSAVGEGQRNHPHCTAHTTSNQGAFFLLMPILAAAVKSNCLPAPSLCGVSVSTPIAPLSPPPTLTGKQLQLPLRQCALVCFRESANRPPAVIFTGVCLLGVHTEDHHFHSTVSLTDTL